MTEIITKNIHRAASLHDLQAPTENPKEAHRFVYRNELNPIQRHLPRKLALCRAVAVTGSHAVGPLRPPQPRTPAPEALMTLGGRLGLYLQGVLDIVMAFTPITVALAVVAIFIRRRS